MRGQSASRDLNGSKRKTWNLSEGLSKGYNFASFDGRSCLSIANCSMGLFSRCPLHLKVEKTVSHGLFQASAYASFTLAYRLANGKFSGRNDISTLSPIGSNDSVAPFNACN